DFHRGPFRFPLASYPDVLLPFLLRGQPLDGRRRIAHSWTADRFIARVYYESRRRVRLDLPGGRAALISDTVGFVRDLPHELVEAFRTTLEEAVETDLVAHVVDASNPHAEAQITAVRATLADIGAAAVPEVMVLNKSDRASPGHLARLTGRYSDALVASAATGEGMTALLAALEERLAPITVELDLLIPYERGDLVAEAHRIGEVLSESHEESGTRLTARIPTAEAGPFRSLSG
ncbi:MAG: hypothetical protein ABIJ75_10225, partial [Actinomycetota bacterium]